MPGNILLVRRYLMVLFAWLFAATATAATTSTSDQKPFAQKRVVLQISDADPSKQTLVLNVASNLVKHYGPDQVDIEIVAFGPGLRILLNKNANAGRIEGLASSGGVRFSACDNTYAKFSEKLGYEPVLNGNAQRVDAGVVRILDLVQQGYTTVKP